MLGLRGQRSSSLDEGATAAVESQRTRKRHRARHTKSRRGCFSCKLRRVKCDEARPACGACSSRGEPCSFPDPSTIPDTTAPTRKLPARGRRNGSPQSQPLDLGQSQSARLSRLPTEDVLAMDDLRLSQFYHLHTAAQMAFDEKRRLVWQRIIPILAANHYYLMHLLLALGGVHMIATQAELKNCTQGPGPDIVDLRVIMEHYQRGLQGFREEVSKISQFNSEAVYAGSLLLVAFGYASLHLGELKRQGVNEDLLSDLIRESQEDSTLHFRWLHLIRGVSSVVSDQWAGLKASRLRPMLLFFHTDEYWKDLPFAPSLTRLSRCSPRLLAFAQGSSQAIANLNAIWAATRPPSVDNPSNVDSPFSPPSLTTLDGAHNEQVRAIGVLDMMYSRISCALQCSTSEQGLPNDLDVQANLEEAAVLSWPIMLTSDFIALLEMTDRDNPVWIHSLIILAHFYVINTLVDSWYLKGSFEREISKISELIDVASDPQLTWLMRWPVGIINS
ncbi:Zn(II)2Cys6 transcription factor domain-containing protein [Aspergillus undulatus]|uniref:Zn(II)2Cys6 transcription factor domain-containing protein n=1 Tax=Aspergillus undulatus TaxID=1810928 RepID=UPI003CCD39D8